MKMQKTIPTIMLLLALFVSLVASPSLAQAPTAETSTMDAGSVEASQREQEAAQANEISPSDVASDVPAPMATLVFTSTDTPINFIDLDCVTSTITIVPPFDLADIEVGLNISHTWKNDLDMWLHAPDGTIVEILTDQDTNYDNFNVLLDQESLNDPNDWLGDAGQLAHHDYTLPPYQYNWFPEGDLSVLYTENAQGDWQLEICDDGAGDSGSLNWWALRFTTLEGPYLYASTKTAIDMVSIGDPITYTLVLTNDAGPTTGAVLTDPIPISTTYIAGSLACTSGNCSYDGGDEAVYWTGEVTPSEPVTVEFAVDTSAAACGSEIVNSAVLSDSALDLGPVTMTWPTRLGDLILGFWDFEADDGGFAATNDWQWGVPTYPPGLGAYSGNNVWATVLDGPYNNLDDFSVLTRTMDLTPYAGYGLTLSWWHYFKANSNADYAEIYINDDLVYDIHNIGLVDTGTWVHENLDISGYGGQVIELRFQFFATEIINDDGWYLDDVGILACLPPEGIWLEPDTLTGAGCPTETLVYNLDLINTAFAPQTIDLSIGDTLFPTTVEPGQVTLDQFESAVITVEVFLPGLPDGTTDVADLLADSGTYNDSATIETTIANLAWQMMEPMPTARAFDAVAAAGGYLYAIGGNDADDLPYDVNEVYDPATNSWTTATPLPIPLSGAKAVAVGDEIYVPGGWTTGDAFTNTTFIYDTVANSWSTIPGISNTLGVTPANVIYYGLAVVGTDIYRMGGLEHPGDDDTTATWKLDTTTNTWTQVASMVYRHFNPAVGAIDDKIYVAGGAQRPGFLKMTQCEVYDPLADTWSDEDMADLPTPAAYAGDAVLEGKLYVIGGHWANSWNNPTWVGIYDPGTDAWQINPDTAELNQGRFYLDADALDGQIFAVGGRDSTGDIVYATNEAYPLSCAPDLVVEAPPLEVSLCPTNTETLTFTLCNEGVAPLQWVVSEMEGTPLLSDMPHKVSAPLFADVADIPATLAQPGAEPQTTPAGDSHIEGYAPTVKAGYTMAAPTLDGIIDPAEWADAMMMDITDPNSPTLQTVSLYIMNTDDTLYLAVDDPNDTTFAETNFDQVGLYFDDDGGTSPFLYDSIWTNATCGNANGEGNFWFGNFQPVMPNEVFREFIIGPNACPLGAAAGATSVISDAAGNVQYEIEIDLAGTSPLIADPTAFELFGFYIYAQDYDTGNTHGLWPPGNVFYDPATYGNLQLAQADIPWLSENPLSGQLAEGECDMVEVTFDSTGLSAGDYYADLIIASNDPDAPETTLPVTMTVWAPAEIVNVTYVISDRTVAFDTTVAGDEPITYTWDFGDGNGSSEEDPVHTYAEYDCYTVTLTAGNVCGTATWNQQICVAEGCLPIMGADFDWSPDEPVISETVIFSGSVAAGDEPITYTWDFGDGTTGEGITMTHAFTPAAEYTVWMTATNCDGEGELVVSHTVTVMGKITPGHFVYLPIILKDY